MPGDSQEWPAPARRDPTPDPDDWAADAERVEEAQAPSSQPEAPAPAPAPSAPVPDSARAPSALRAATPPPPTPPPARRGESQDAIPRTVDPPPTRVHSGEHNFKPPAVRPIPDVPEGGLFNAVRYALAFARARWQRRSAINELSGEIQDETAALDGVLGTLGRQARSHQVDNRVLSVENNAIDEAERRRARCEQECFDLSARHADENNKFADVEGEREGKAQDAEQTLERARRELAGLEAQRRSLREKRKTLERQQKAYLKAADERDEQAGRSAMGDARAGLRRAAEDMRRDAAALDPERQDIDRRLSALDKPLSQATAKVEALKAEHDSARRSLNDAREGHRHRLAEIEAEQGRKSRELAQCEAEIQRRLVTLGTLVNLHRIDRPEFEDMYSHIDALRAAIGARSTEIDRMTAEREAYDKASLVRGFLVLAGGIVALVTLIVIALAIF